MRTVSVVCSVDVIVNVGVDVSVTIDTVASQHAHH
jgi:hypothetical protein